MVKSGNSKKMAENEGQDHPWEPLPDPLTLERKQTHRPFLIAFAVFIGSWIFVAVCAFNNGIVKINDDRNNVTQKNDTSHSQICWKCAMNNNSEINNEVSNSGIDPTPFLTAKFIVLGIALLSMFLSLIFVILSKLSEKLVHYMSIHFNLGLMLLIVGIFAYKLFTGQGLSFITYVILTVIATFIFIVALTACIYLRPISMKACKEVQIMAKLNSYLPNSLIIPIIQSILFGLTALFSASIMIYLSAYPKDENNPNFDTFIRIFHFINVFGFLWMIFFINGFGQMLITGNLTTWYWSEDEESVPKFTIVRYVHIIIRYHIGTVAYGSLAALAFSLIVFLMKWTYNLCNGGCKSFLCLKFDFLGRTFIRIARFLYRFDSTNTYTACIIYGNQKINEEFLIKFESKPTNVILLIGQLSIIGLSTLATLLCCHIFHFESHVEYTAIASIVVSTIMITWAFSTLVRVSKVASNMTKYEFYLRLKKSGYHCDPILYWSKANSLFIELRDYNRNQEN